ncbi:hypothetical protein M422DRAFT_35216 [Sphaerobolus stellatus SS14]|uniref:Uncharacterized protein n=1 Tax=Sphaerobolus stellatus (strain SS14) TaxID=990650 RepID=A0A0C9UXW5_SPHS4|nr:hypothetical protein M422DRAFT_35216 [Sphaerobolus stellatus SS14]
MKAFFPTFEDGISFEDMKYIDPRLWVTIIQLISGLPESLNRYAIPLSDTYLPRLQAIHPTPNMTLITILDLSGRLEITDDSIDRLGSLMGLAVLNLSFTNVTSWGIKKLVMCIGRDETGEFQGPGRLRILSLRGCGRVTDNIREALERFPLLSVVDLRRTQAKNIPFGGFKPTEEQSHSTLFFPLPTLTWMDALLEKFPTSNIFLSKSRPYILHIYRLIHPSLPARAQSSNSGGSTLTLFPDGSVDVQSASDDVKPRIKSENNSRKYWGAKFKGRKAVEGPMDGDGSFMDWEANMVAEQELERHNSRARADHFYSKATAPTPKARQNIDWMSINQERGLQGRVEDRQKMFLRQPPDYDTLPALNKSSSSSIFVTQSEKDKEVMVKRIKIDDSKDLRRKKVAANLLRAIFQDNSSTSNTIEPVEDASPKPAPGRNPFAVKRTKSGAMRRQSSDITSSQPSSDPKETSTADFNSSERSSSDIHSSRSGPKTLSADISTTLAEKTIPDPVSNKMPTVPASLKPKKNVVGNKPEKPKPAFDMLAWASKKK